MLGHLRSQRVLVYAGAADFAIEGADHAQSLRFTHPGRSHRIETPLVLLHQGVVPNTQFSWALRAPHRWDEAQSCWVPETDACGRNENTGIYLAGDCRGIVGARASASQGRLAAIAVALNLRPGAGKDLKPRETAVRVSNSRSAPSWMRSTGRWLRTARRRTAR